MQREVSKDPVSWGGYEDNFRTAERTVWPMLMAVVIVAVVVVIIIIVELSDIISHFC